jgi:hypothetical protein|tara:strand:- start:158 stop:1141 length:984 start_codon:yes stop_codon:yes gene_type:complete
MSLIYGNRTCSIEEVAAVVTPDSTGRHTPIPHTTLIDETKKALEAAGFEIVEEAHKLDRGGLRYFGGFALTREDLAGEDRQIVCGLRNSHDKAFAAGICIGNRMMVCDNLCFSSEKVIGRRHTTQILRDLPSVITKVIASLVTEWLDMSKRIESYKDCELTRAEAAELAVRLVDGGALMKQKLYDVIQLWEKPELAAKNMIEEDDFIVTTQGEQGFVDDLDQEAFDVAVGAKEAELALEFGQGENLWGLYNAVTEILKGSDLSKLPTRTMNMQSLMDAVAGHVRVVGEEIAQEGDPSSEEGQANFEESFAETEAEEVAQTEEVAVID